MIRLWICSFFILLSYSLISQTIWTGPKTIFTKENFANYELPENQDRITDRVRITRQFNQGIYNIAIEIAYQTDSSPAGTEWAFGTSDSLPHLIFQSWQEAIHSQPPQMVGKNMVMHLIEADIYIDLKFLSWQPSSSGGGFSYERSTDPIAGAPPDTRMTSIRLFPNPVGNFMRLEGLEHIKHANYEIMNLAGTVILNGDNASLIDVKALSPGLYLFKMTHHSEVILIRFQKV